MEYKLEDFDDFFDNTDKYSDEEAIEKCEQWLIFIKTNQAKYKFTDEDIARGEQLLEVFKQSYRKHKISEQNLKITEGKVNEAARRVMKTIDQIESQGKKVSPMFKKLVSKKHGSH